MVLLSDGLVNQGRSPAYSEFSFPIYSVAVGDTMPKKDLRLTGLTYNRVAFSGNKFPLEAETGLRRLCRRHGHRGAARRRPGARSRRVALPAGRRRVRTTFQLTAPAPGKRRYEVRVVPQPGEFTPLNNARTAFIEIVKGKLRVLLAGAAPHPDLKALRAAILANDNFDLTLALPGVAPAESRRRLRRGHPAPAAGPGRAGQRDSGPGAGPHAGASTSSARSRTWRPTTSWAPASPFSPAAPRPTR